MITARENFLRMLEYGYPETLPCFVNMAPIVWKTYKKDLAQLVLEHPRIFPDFNLEENTFYDQMPPVYRLGETYVDNWGCTWLNAQEGMEGQVVGHPLADWTSLRDYRMPDPLVADERKREAKDWEKAAQDVLEFKRAGKIASGNGERLFDRLYFLRGFDNLMMDFALESPELPHLIEMLQEYELTLIQQWINLGVDMVGFHTDFGMQTGMMISPRSFRKYIKPMFKQLFQTCRKAGVHVLLSSDGRILEAVDDLIECGVSVHDPQLRANTLEGIVRVYKGKLPALVDLDRQGFPFMTSAEIRRQVEEVVTAMYLPEGGLGITAAVYGTDVSLTKIAALLDAIEEFCFDRFLP